MSASISDGECCVTSSNGWLVLVIPHLSSSSLVGRRRTLYSTQFTVANHAGQLVRGQLPPRRLEPEAGQGRLAMGYEAGSRWWEARPRVRWRSED